MKHKLVAVLNKSISPGDIMNALAHMSVGLGGICNEEQLQLIDYQDADGNTYPHISKYPFIILKSNASKLKKLYVTARESDIRMTVFTDQMKVGGWQQQLDNSKAIKFDDLTIYGVTLFGEQALVSELTRKFSLWV